MEPSHVIALPVSYNGIHDPTISMVALYTMTEGALDVIR